MDNAPSYDARMEDMPVLISYPRSGSNWLNSIMELYFDRPRLRIGPTSFLKNREARTDFMWFHDHDITSELKLTHDNILYLYRDPCDVIFSLLMAEHRDAMLGDAPVLALVKKQLELIRNHHAKYLDNYTTIRYEDCKEDLPNEFEIILQFFGYDEPVDVGRLLICMEQAKKGQLIAKATDKRYFNAEMMSTEYERRRADFRNTYEQGIDEYLKGKYGVAQKKLCPDG